MRGFVPPDPDTDVSSVKHALVYAPRLRRHRFSANCVTLMQSAEAALAAQCVQQDLHAARVLGPSKSSEGQFIYYLVEWLDESVKR